MEQHSRVSHPVDMQRFVFEGDGVALIREGATLLGGLTTLPVLGKSWTVDTALVYPREHYLKTIPVLVRELRQLAKESKRPVKEAVVASPNEGRKRPARPNGKTAEQLSLLDELPDECLSA